MDQILEMPMCLIQNNTGFPPDEAFEGFLVFVSQPSSTAHSVAIEQWARAIARVQENSLRTGETRIHRCTVHSMMSDVRLHGVDKVVRLRQEERHE